MNYMNDVADLLGLKLMDKFKLQSTEYGTLYDNEYWLDEKGMQGPDYRDELDGYFCEVLTGKYKIHKLT